MIPFKISTFISFLDFINISYNAFQLCLDTVKVCVFGNCLQQLVSNKFHKILQWSQVRLRWITNVARKFISHLRYIVFSPSKIHIFLIYKGACQWHIVFFVKYFLYFFSFVISSLIFPVMVWFFFFFKTFPIIHFFANILEGIIIIIFFIRQCR